MKNNNEIIKEYLKKNNIGELSITQLGMKMNVSVSAITRYAQTEGFNGFKELKYFYNKNMNTNAKDEIEQFLLNTVFSAKRTNESIDMKKVEWLAKQITSKENIVILGEAFTFINAQYLERLLRKININASSRNVASELTILSSQKDTVFIFLSNSGMNNNIKRAAKKLYANKKQGQVLVSVTSNNYSNISEVANEWISGYFYQENNLLQYELPSVGNTVMNFIINIIYTSVYKLNKQKYDEIIKMIAYEKEK